MAVNGYITASCNYSPSLTLKSGLLRSALGRGGGTREVEALQFSRGAFGAQTPK